MARAAKSRSPVDDVGQRVAELKRQVAAASTRENRLARRYRRELEKLADLRNGLAGSGRIAKQEAVVRLVEREWAEGKKALENCEEVVDRVRQRLLPSPEQHLRQFLRGVEEDRARTRAYLREREAFMRTALSRMVAATPPRTAVALARDVNREFLEMGGSIVEIKRNIASAIGYEKALASRHEETISDAKDLREIAAGELFPPLVPTFTARAVRYERLAELIERCQDAQRAAVVDFEQGLSRVTELEDEARRGWNIFRANEHIRGAAAAIAVVDGLARQAETLIGKASVRGRTLSRILTELGNRLEEAKRCVAITIADQKRFARQDESELSDGPGKELRLQRSATHKSAVEALLADLRRIMLLAQGLKSDGRVAPA